MGSVLYHCDCGRGETSDTCPPVASRAFEHHQLSHLYFCEECDAIRCSRCVLEELVCFYCPLCLFEATTASVRGEFHRCARNCFECPQCTHTLSVTASDPTSKDGVPIDPRTPASNIGEPPYYLSCSFCRWDSKEVGVTFEKATGLAQQLQKAEAATPAVLSFDHVKDHLEPYLKAGMAQNQPANAALLPRASALSSLPSRYGSLLGLAQRARPAAHLVQSYRDELEPYDALYAARKEARKEKDKLDFMQTLTSLDAVASVEQKGSNAWQQTIVANQLKPSRVPLQAKRSKRCHICKHVIVKPEAKSTSIKYRIKLVAVNYLPSMELFRRPPITSGANRLSVIGSAATLKRKQASQAAARLNESGSALSDDDPLRPGRSYTFEIAFVNPLYEQIQVQVSLPSLDVVEKPSSSEEGSSEALPFTLHFPTTTFPIAPFAEPWEYEDAENEDLTMLDADDNTHSRKSRRRQPPGLVEKKANRTTISLELSVGRDYVGPVKTHVLVTYFYTADTSTADGDKKTPQANETKSFAFWTLLSLGTSVPLGKSRIVTPQTGSAPLIA